MVSEVKEFSKSTLMTPHESAAIDRTPRPEDPAPTRPGRRTDTVKPSGEQAQGQTVSGRRPREWNVAMNSSQDESDPNN